MVRGLCENAEVVCQSFCTRRTDRRRLKMNRCIPVIFLAVLIGPWADAAAETGKIWDVGDQGRFDNTNKRVSMDGNRVVVSLDDEDSLCPRELGGEGPGRKRITEILFRYNARSAQGCWLHIAWLPGESGKEQFEVLFNNKLIGKSKLVDAVETHGRRNWECFNLEQQAGANEISVRHVSGDGLQFDCLVLAASAERPVPVRPFPKTPTLKAYEKEIGEEAVVLDDRYVRICAPKRWEKEAGIILQYLAKAYDELYRIAGLHTEYKIIVYHFPKLHPYCAGGTSKCTIRYSYENLDLESRVEWQQHRVPHVAGYIEEMAHNFVASSMAVFGWEMVGWSICQEACAKVAANPIHTKRILRSREVQKETYQRYVEGGFTVPKDIPSNLSDRIHAHILWEFRREYGPLFWHDFFAAVREREDDLRAAKCIRPDTEARDARYRITVDCFDSVTAGEFRKMLNKSRISLTHEVTPIDARDPGWNRKFE